MNCLKNKKKRSNLQVYCVCKSAQAFDTREKLHSVVYIV